MNRASFFKEITSKTLSAATTPRRLAASAFAPNTCEVIQSGGTAYIPAGGISLLKMAHQFGGNLLDYTDPTAPTVNSPGKYWFGATVQCSSGQQLAGCALLVVGVKGMSSVDAVSTDQVIDLKLFETPRASASVEWDLDLGDPIGLAVINRGTKELKFDLIMGLLSLK
jgi:hypothetical protein